MTECVSGHMKKVVIVPIPKCNQKTYKLVITLVLFQSMERFITKKHVAWYTLQWCLKQRLGWSPRSWLAIYASSTQTARVRFVEPRVGKQWMCNTTCYQQGIWYCMGRWVILHTLPFHRPKMVEDNVDILHTFPMCCTYWKYNVQLVYC